MLDHLQIQEARDRVRVAAADVALSLAGPVLRAGRSAPGRPPSRILLFRLERIGDLLMALEAIADVRRAAPLATVDLVVGSWNREMAATIPGIRQVHLLDAPWLAREQAGMSFAAMLRHAATWRETRYDLGLNFEPDIRSNVLLAWTRARRTAGFRSGGGGALLDVALDYNPRAHTSDNCRRLVAAVLDVPPSTAVARLEVTAHERGEARAILGARRGHGPLVGIHVSGGRAIKQWDVARFAEVAARLAKSAGATIVLSGSVADCPLVAGVAAALEGLDVLDLAGRLELPQLAAVLAELDVLITGDTGPMHVAAAVDTPVVAVLGPSDPARYAPRGPRHRVVRVDLPCSPCNRIRQPPARCVGHTPDCLVGVTSEAVYDAVVSVLTSRATVPAIGH